MSNSHGGYIRTQCFVRQNGQNRRFSKKVALRKAPLRCLREMKKSSERNIRRRTRTSHPAVPFRATRKHHHAESAEDYTELIADLIEENGEARVVAIAERLGISHVTAIKTIQRLERDGYIITTPYKPVTLTQKGKETAAFCKRRHQTLRAFLISLGVPEQTARIDAEGIEHHVSPITLERIELFLRKQ